MENEMGAIISALGGLAGILLARYLLTSTSLKGKINSQALGISLLIGGIILGALVGGQIQGSTKSLGNSAMTSPTVTTAPQPSTTSTPAPPTGSGCQEFQQPCFASLANTVSADTLVANPAEFTDQKIRFDCTFMNIVHDSSGNPVGVNCQIPDSTGDIYLDLSGSSLDVTQLHQSDQLRIWAIGKGSYTGTNTFGGTITEAAVQLWFTLDTTSGYQDW
jgi:hypothetical protein